MDATTSRLLALSDYVLSLNALCAWCRGKDSGIAYIKVQIQIKDVVSNVISVVWVWVKCHIDGCLYVLLTKNTSDVCLKISNLAMIIQARVPYYPSLF